MNISVHKIIIITLCALIMSNIWVYGKGIGLSDEIQSFEHEIQRLEKDNLELEVRIYGIDSISQTASIAAQLQFGSEGSPLHIDRPHVAYQP